MNNRPVAVVSSKSNGTLTCATPCNAALIEMLGCAGSSGNVAFTTDQMRAMERAYEFDFNAARAEAGAYAEEAHKQAMAEFEKRRAELPGWQQTHMKPPVRPNLAGVGEFAAAGCQRDLMRYAEVDGLRMVAVIAQFLEPGQDPVKLLCQLMSEAGLDVREDADWYYAEEGVP